MKTRRRSPILSLIFLLLAILALLAIGALIARRNFLSRGISETLPKPMNYGGVQLGINVELEQYDQLTLEETLSQIKAAGFTAVKQPFFFDQSFDWTASDRIVEAVTEHELTLVPLLDGQPAGAFAPPADLNVFAEWAGEFAHRYGNVVDHYIVWDEPNLTSHWGNQPVNPLAYAALLTAASQTIRAADADAAIVAAPLAPTEETGPKNLADPLFLQGLYEAGATDAFDVVAAKPYGFDTGPEDRRVDIGRLNFSRTILLREVMERNGDGNKAIWAGNWGWNSLPKGWQGLPSIWGQVDEQTQAEWTVSGLIRARQEWPWMGLMFLENWEPVAGDDDPRWGFSIAGRPTEEAIQAALFGRNIAYPGFHLASDSEPAQNYDGNWRFSPEFGADIDQTGDWVTFDFWGTDAGLRVRRADFNARFFVEVDGEPANAIPLDEGRASLVLSSPDPAEDYIAIEKVAENLSPGEHTMTVTADRGWDQWALNGFSVGFKPSDTTFKVSIVVLSVFALACIVLAFYTGRKANWSIVGKSLTARLGRLNNHSQLALTAIGAALVALTGWLTWGEQAAGVYRRLGDGGQLALTAAAASVFYVTPFFVIYLAALAIFFLLVYMRPAWGLAVVAFAIPYYVNPKPLLGYRFSPVEIFLLVTLAAFVLRLFLNRLSRPKADQGITNPTFSPILADYAVLAFAVVATLSLLFTERLDVATNEWRLVILEPALLYLLFRWMRLKDTDVWTILDAFILGSLLVALIGLGQYVTGQNLITSEEGLMRLRSIYGSPNNVALYLGRILPILAAMTLMGSGRRRIAYAVAIIPIGLAILLTFSKGSLLIGVPASLVVVFIIWRRSLRGRIWPWLLGFAAVGALAFILALQIPQLAGRLNPQGETGLFRVNLWLASLNMVRDHPVFGIGLDNFLYAYRGRYILGAAWQEPNLSHPHNIVLDFATRLGLVGLLAGLAMILAFTQALWKLPSTVPDQWKPIAAGIAGSLVYILAHGLVDHSFFIVDLAFAFMLLLGVTVWLRQNQVTSDD